MVVEDLENVKDEQFDYYEDNFKVEDDDELVAFYGAMYHDEESSQDKKVIWCAMMHKNDLPGLEELSISLPVQEKWSGHANMVQCIKSTVKNVIAAYNT